MARAAAHGRLQGNLKRDILNTVVRGSDMPDLYWAQVPSNDRTTGDKTMFPLAFWLVHEMLHYFFVEKRSVDLNEAVELPDGSGQAMEHIAFCAKHKVQASETVRIGIHGDGVSHQKGGSIEVLSAFG